MVTHPRHSHDVVATSRAILSQKARSFRWAAQFLPAQTHDDAALLYAFCRHVDDTTDEALSPHAARHHLHLIKAQLRGSRPPDPLLANFMAMAERTALELDYAFELIQGMESDLVDQVVMEDDVALLRYCYRAAGTVGLMMCAVLGVKDPEALPFAVDLGVAMQLTNICRDVAEDAAMNRVYLPKVRLHHHGSSPALLLAGQARAPQVARVVDDLISLADVYYRSAHYGMQFIPSRSRLAILIASQIYRGIGLRLRTRHDSDALRGRTVVPWTGKTRLATYAVGKFAALRMTPYGTGVRHDARLHRALKGLPGTDPLS